MTIDGKSESLSAYKGKTVLIVNVASKCGFTPQYSGLQSLFAKYKDEGLSSLVFLPTTLQVKNLVRMLKLEPFVPESTTPPFRCSRKCQSRATIWHSIRMSPVKQQTQQLPAKSSGTSRTFSSGEMGGHWRGLSRGGSGRSRIGRSRSKRSALNRFSSGARWKNWPYACCL
jgi:glutathione peroxidase